MLIWHVNVLCPSLLQVISLASSDIALCQLQLKLSKKMDKVTFEQSCAYSAQSSLLLSLSLTPFRNISLTTTNMQMTPSCRKPPFPPISARCLEKLKSVLRTWKTGWTKTNLNSMKRKLSSWSWGTAPASVKWRNNRYIWNNAVPFQTSAKYLGVHLDETLSMKE